MKTIPLLLLGFTIPVIAGTEAVVSTPAPEPCIYTWFTGASVGYLTELEEPMYNFHLGVSNSCWNAGGWRISTFLEVGYASKDDSWSGNDSPPEVNPFASIDEDYDIEINEDSVNASLDLGDIEDLLSDLADSTPFDTGYDFDVMPITLNVKFDRQFADNFHGYFGGGLGMALVDFSADVDRLADFSDDDWVFTGQLFAGLSYSFNPDFEAYSGIRWIYYDDAGLSSSDIDLDLEMDDDFLIEIGARFNF
jgi:opacity protein-like surface antigen